MQSEILSLVEVAALTGLLWLPYVLNRMIVWGLPDTLGYPKDPKPLAAWAQRLKSAHANAVENLVVFAALVLSAHALGVSTPTTVFACMLYFWSRVVHAVAYTLAWPVVRTLGFFGGFVAQVLLVVQMMR